MAESNETEHLAPIALTILIHYYSGTDYPFNGGESQWVSRLVDNGLLEHSGDDYIITRRGVTHVLGLCAAPLPKERWVSPLRPFLEDDEHE